MISYTTCDFIFSQSPHNRHTTICQEIACRKLVINSRTSDLFRLPLSDMCEIPIHRKSIVVNPKKIFFTAQQSARLVAWIHENQACIHYSDSSHNSTNRFAFNASVRKKILYFFFHVYLPKKNYLRMAHRHFFQSKLCTSMVDDRSRTAQFCPECRMCLFDPNKIFLLKTIIISWNK